ncbi:MAG: hypothetical protein U0Z44_06005 [Kouleothrix sp.]
MEYRIGRYNARQTHKRLAERIQGLMQPPTLLVNLALAGKIQCGDIDIAGGLDRIGQWDERLFGPKLAGQAQHAAEYHRRAGTQHCVICQEVQKRLLRLLQRRREIPWKNSR